MNKPKLPPPARSAKPASELVIITGLSGSGKGTVLKALEDLGYYAVDNLPIGLIPKFAELTKDSANIRRAALVVDIREGEALKVFPRCSQAHSRGRSPARLIFLEADDATLVRRFSETRRPHPGHRTLCGRRVSNRSASNCSSIRALADLIVNTSKFNVHELRETIGE